MENQAMDWSLVPDVISKEQLYKLCHISKKHARFLLLSGKIPCEKTGKKTWGYRIKKEDVQHYLENRTVKPNLYTVPVHFYKTQTISPGEKPSPHELREHYEELLKQQPDTLKTKDIAVITGYGPERIYQWCRVGILKCFVINQAYVIPKQHFIEFLCDGHVLFASLHGTESID